MKEGASPISLSIRTMVFTGWGMHVLNVSILHSKRSAILVVAPYLFHELDEIEVIT